MGGLGSGCWYRYNSRTTVESCKSIDIRRFKRDGLLYNNSSFSWKWSRDGEPSGDINVKIQDSLIILNYRSRSYGEAWEPVEQPTRITYTECNFGGKRPWFICPGIVNGHNCERRIATLYAAGKYFLCRHCYDLAYSSQQEAGFERALRKARKIRHKLGASDNVDDPIYEKPKGMHWTTFSKLTRQSENFAWESENHLQKLLSRLMMV